MGSIPITRFIKNKQLVDKRNNLCYNINISLNFVSWRVVREA
ncbi:hypothetical protein PI27_gp004 [Listeria phage WIL-1]|nr:hypothetical protein PI27_gp004 [Listeria phage WIL-1]